jgi:hypothetical protein
MRDVKGLSPDADPDRFGAGRGAYAEREGF